MNRKRLFVALCGAAALASGGAARAQAMLGVHLGNPSLQSGEALVLSLEGALGRNIAIDSDYENWGTFPDTGRVQWDIQQGLLPMQSWRIEFSDLDPNTCATAKAINAGVYDTQIIRQARTIRSLGAPVLIRFNYEMTDNAENTCFTGFPVNNNWPLAGQEFVSAWRHVVGLFRAAGATNAVWVWAPGAGSYVEGSWPYFWPGAAWVDWIGIDDYNKVDTPSSFATDPGIPQFIPAVGGLGKPLMVSENGALEDPNMNPDAQTRWVETARTYIKAHPQIKAYVYWDTEGAILPPPPYDGTGYILKGAGMVAFKALANDPWFKAPPNARPPPP